MLSELRVLVELLDKFNPELKIWRTIQNDYQGIAYFKIEQEGKTLKVKVQKGVDKGVMKKAKAS